MSKGHTQQYEAEWINGTSLFWIDGKQLEIKEQFNFDQPSCPNTTDSESFSSFTCFDYMEDTVMTKEETTTPVQQTASTVVVPTMHIAIFSGLGAAFFLVIIAVVIYKIKKGKWFKPKLKTVKYKIPK